MPLIHGSAKVFKLDSVHTLVELCKAVATGEHFCGNAFGGKARAIPRPVATEQDLFFLSTSPASTGAVPTEAVFYTAALPPEGIVCTGDQLVMTWDNGPYGWKRADELVPGGDALMMYNGRGFGGNVVDVPMMSDELVPSADVRVVSNECAYDGGVVNAATGLRPDWARRVLRQAIRLSTASEEPGTFYEISCTGTGLMCGADIGPDYDTPRPNTYVASGFLLHTGVGRIFAPPASV